MYERYSEPARYAIFYAIAFSRLNESQVVDSEHLLMALIRDEQSRSNILFHLQDHFPQYSARPSKFASYEDAPGPLPALTDDMKRILVRTAWEADAIRHYWIDTEHLLLGILTEPDCLAARYLAKSGVSLKTARRIVIDNAASRPEYGPVSSRWNLQSPLEKWIFKWRMRKYRKEAE